MGLTAAGRNRRADHARIQVRVESARGAKDAASPQDRAYCCSDLGVIVAIRRLRPVVSATGKLDRRPAPKCTHRVWSATRVADHCLDAVNDRIDSRPRLVHAIRRHAPQVDPGLAAFAESEHAHGKYAAFASCPPASPTPAAASDVGMSARSSTASSPSLTWNTTTSWTIRQRVPPSESSSSCPSSARCATRVSSRTRAHGIVENAEKPSARRSILALPTQHSEYAPQDLARLTQRIPSDRPFFLSDHEEETVERLAGHVSRRWHPSPEPVRTAQPARRARCTASRAVHGPSSPSRPAGTVAAAGRKRPQRAEASKITPGLGTLSSPVSAELAQRILRACGHRGPRLVRSRDFRAAPAVADCPLAATG